MKRILPIAWLVIAPVALYAEPEFPLGEDSKPHENVPKGELIKLQFDKSKIFPGTTREVLVYVPKQYDGTSPACVYINQDGQGWNASTVFDNLIAKGDIPVLIGVYIKPGVMKALDEKAALPRFNRSLEYDGLGSDYAQFLLDEILPEVEKLQTTDGRKILLSKNGNDRAIGGSSSGAICAFTAAWERPDAFSRVFTVVCTMVGLRGANEYPTLIRKYEPKALRIFQQDGSNDNNIYGGDWWMANQELERSLTFSGYEHDHIWGEGGHNGKHGTVVFPDAMRYLWKGWPTPVKAGVGGNKMLNEILLPNEGWDSAMDGPEAIDSLISNQKGEVLVSTPNKQWKIALDGKLQASDLPSVKAISAKGQFLGASVEHHSLMAYGVDSSKSVLIEGIVPKAIASLSNGNSYVGVLSDGKQNADVIWLLRPDGTKQIASLSGLDIGSICGSTDQSLLYVSDAVSKWIYSYQIQADGTLSSRQRYYWLHVPDTENNAGTGGMVVDLSGRLFVGTHLGIQVCDQAGRVNVILPVPTGKVTALAFGGDARDVLYASVGGKLFKRKLNTKGAMSFESPVKPPAPHL